MLDKTPIVPFLKWAGGKRWLARDHSDLFSTISGSRYIEPFLGSGAVFFPQPKQAILNDANVALIETYTAVQRDWEGVSDKLRQHHRLHSADYFYRVRSARPTSLTGRAARFIYLNRTCFNGLYRVNRQGVFNVPVGTKTDVLLGSDDFSAVSRALRDVELRALDFEEIVSIASDGDFVFADPPYTVKHNANGFIKYNEKLFSWEDQVRLRDALLQAAERGATVLLTNADHSSVRELYTGCNVRTLHRHSVMASESHRRRKTTEVLISLGSKNGPE